MGERVLEDPIVQTIKKGLLRFFTVNEVRSQPGDHRIRSKVKQPTLRLRLKRGDTYMIDTSQRRTTTSPILSGLGVRCTFKHSTNSVYQVNGVCHTVGMTLAGLHLTEASMNGARPSLAVEARKNRSELP